MRRDLPTRKEFLLRSVALTSVVSTLGVALMALYLAALLRLPGEQWATFVRAVGVAFAVLFATCLCGEPEAVRAAGRVSGRRRERERRAGPAGLPARHAAALADLRDGRSLVGARRARGGAGHRVARARLQRLGRGHPDRGRHLGRPGRDDLPLLPEQAAARAGAPRAGAAPGRARAARGAGGAGRAAHEAAGLRDGRDARGGGVHAAPRRLPGAAPRPRGRGGDPARLRRGARGLGPSRRPRPRAGRAARRTPGGAGDRGGAARAPGDLGAGADLRRPARRGRLGDRVAGRGRHRARARPRRGAGRRGGPQPVARPRGGGRARYPLALLRAHDRVAARDGGQRGVCGERGRRRGRSPGGGGGRRGGHHDRAGRGNPPRGGLDGGDPQPDRRHHRRRGHALPVGGRVVELPGGARDGRRAAPLDGLGAEREGRHRELVDRPHDRERAPRGGERGRPERRRRRDRGGPRSRWPPRWDTWIRTRPRRVGSPSA